MQSGYTVADGNFSARRGEQGAIALDILSTIGIELKLGERRNLVGKGGAMRHPAIWQWPARKVFVNAVVGVSATFATPYVVAGEPVVAAATPVAPSAEQITGWVRDLDADDYDLRETATTQLQAAGPAAVEALTRALLSPSAEAADRANLILQRIASHSDETVLDQLTAAIQKLGSKRASITKMAAEFKAQQQKFKHRRALARVRALGGGLSGNWDGEAVADGGPHVIMPAMMPPPVMIFDDEAVVPAIAIEAVRREIGDAAPAIDLSVIEPPVAIPPAPEPAPGPRGLMGLLARLIAPDPAPRLAIGPAPRLEAIREEIGDAAPIPLAPPIPVAPAAEVPTAEAAATEIPALEIPRIAAPPELPTLPEPVPAPAEPPVALEVAVAEAVAMDEVFIAPAMGFAVPVEMGLMGEPGDAYAELRLDAAFRGTDADLAVLKDIPEIYSLSISGAKLTDAALPHISALPRLTTLNVQQTPFSAAALRKLRGERPELSVICRGVAMLGINAGLEGPCVITSVFPSSGAYAAGLRDEDEILEVSGHKIRDFSDLTIAVYPHKPGDKISVKYRRQGEEKIVEVLLKPRAAE